MLMYLNFEGVLHPNHVSLTEMLGERTPPPSFRDNVESLWSAIATYPALGIMLNTWWVYAIGYERTIRFLPDGVVQRLRGSTLEHSSRYSTPPSRIDVAQQHAFGQGIESTVFLDHNGARYGPKVRPRCFLLDADRGLSDEQATMELTHFLVRAAM